MSKRLFLKTLAQLNNKQWEKTKANPEKYQNSTFVELLNKGKGTHFGTDHNLGKITNYREFVENVPVRTYEEFIPYIEQIKQGRENVLYPGRPTYFARTSGTTANVKFIPIYPPMLKKYSQLATYMLTCYALNTGNYDIFTGRGLNITGSPLLDNVNGILTGRMSGISYYSIPHLFKRFVLPSFKTNSINDFDKKIDAIIAESVKYDLKVLGGIPPWVMLYIDRLLELKNIDTLQEIFPNLKLLVHAGVNFEPYRQYFYSKFGFKVDTLDCYTSSEGHFGFQESPDDRQMTLSSDNGVFYEFIPVETLKKSAVRIPLKDVRINQNYAVVLNTISGLWGYMIGDIIKFTSLEPLKFVFVGRVSQFTSLFGEHVIEEEVRHVIEQTSNQFNFKVRHFTVAPMVMTEKHMSHQEWWVEFDEIPAADLESIALDFTKELSKMNPYFKDLIHSKAISPIKIKVVQKNGFNLCMEKMNRRDMQNKIPVLSNDRVFVEHLSQFSLIK